MLYALCALLVAVVLALHSAIPAYRQAGAIRNPHLIHPLLYG